MKLRSVAATVAASLCLFASSATALAGGIPDPAAEQVWYEGAWWWLWQGVLYSTV